MSIQDYLSKDKCINLFTADLWSKKYGFIGLTIYYKFSNNYYFRIYRDRVSFIIDDLPSNFSGEFTDVNIPISSLFEGCNDLNEETFNHIKNYNEEELIKKFKRILDLAVFS